MSFHTSPVLNSLDLDDLAPAQRRVADYVAALPSDVERLSISDLARAAGVSAGTVTKFCHAVGFTDFRTFRLELARANALGGRNPTPTESGTLADRVKESLSRATRILERTIGDLDLAAFKAAVEAFDRADRILIYGVGGSGAIAMDAHFRFLRIGLNAAAYVDTQVQLWSTATLKPTDVVVAISHSGRTKDTVEALSLAGVSGCKTIALTSHKYSPLAERADICLVSSYEETPSNDGGVLARISQLGIVDALAEEVAARHPEHVDRAEKVVSALRSRNR
jgi:RpiR family carbohydrate utilization transcriptional regulator